MPFPKAFNEVIVVTGIQRPGPQINWPLTLPLDHFRHFEEGSIRIWSVLEGNLVQ
jgi:hypothetical protein